MVKSLSNSNYL